MSSRQKRKIGRTNGAKAAGTKSPEGLQKSSMNALRHGLTSKTLVLSNESQTKFDELLDSFIRKFRPQDEVELELVTEMVAARWRLRRIWAIQTAALDLQMDKMETEVAEKFQVITEPTRLGLAFTTMANEGRSLQLLLRYESTYRRMYNQAQRDLLRLRESAASKESPNEPTPPPAGFVSPPPATPPDAQIEPQAPPVLPFAADVRGETDQQTSEMVVERPEQP
jgi:hypothetical protein